MSVGKSIYSLLSSATDVTNIVGTKISPSRVPQVEDFPAITYHQVSNVPTDEKGAVSGFDKEDFDIICWSRSYDEVNRMAEAVRTALDRVSIDTQGVNIDTIVFVSSIDSFSDQAEMFQRNIQFKFIVIPEDYDANAKAYFNAVATPFTDARKTIIDTLVTTLKADGNWDELDALWLLANEASDQGLVNLRSPLTTDMTLVSSPTFTVDQGFTSGGSGYIDTNFNPSTDATKYLLDDASFGVYSRTDSTNASTVMGLFTSPNGSLLIPRYGANVITASVNDTFNNSVGTNTVGTLGLFSAVRDSSSTSKVYHDGVESYSIAANASTSVLSLDFFLLTLNNNGSPATKTVLAEVSFAIRSV